MSKEKEEIKLSDELQKLLESKGNTPISEPKLHKMLFEDNADPVDVFEEAIKGVDIKLDDYDKKPKEVYTFIGDLTRKLQGYKTEDGVCKVTPNTEDCLMPTLKETRMLRKEIDKVSESDDKSVESVEKKFLKVSGLDIKKLTDWEKELVIVTIQTSMSDYFSCLHGADAKK